MATEELKPWLRISRELDGEIQIPECEDSIIYWFARPIKGVSNENSFILDISKTSCSVDQFCAVNPNICDNHESICEESPSLCEGLFPGIFFAGSWEVHPPSIENGKTDVFQINFPGDTVIYQIDFITSIFLDVRYQNQSGEVTESYIFE